jgi:hypothetical protein
MLVLEQAIPNRAEQEHAPPPKVPYQCGNWKSLVVMVTIAAIGQAARQHFWRRVLVARRGERSKLPSVLLPCATGGVAELNSLENCPNPR